MQYHSNSTQSELKPIFTSTRRSPAIRWVCLAVGLGACGVVGIWQGVANYTLNTFIVGVSLYSIAEVFFWLRRLKRHRQRSAQVVRQCFNKITTVILTLEEDDRPIALTLLKAVCLKIQRGRGASHERLLGCLEQSLLSELGPVVRVAKVLPAMGLTGTCLGMMGTLHQIGLGAEDVTDIDAISAAVGGALPAMALAVSTTLAAAFMGSVLLFGLVDVAKTELHSFVDELDGQLDMFPFGGP